MPTPATAKRPVNAPWRARWVIAAGLIACGALVWLSVAWPELRGIPGVAQILTPPPTANDTIAHYPFIELMKLVVAGVLGLLLTAVHRHTCRDRQPWASLEHAQVLLCISGAIIMIIIGNSLARAFGIAGGASIVRFRTPVEDPKDALILFLLLAIGMACGLAAFGVAVLATLFLIVVLLVLDRMSEHRPREMVLEVVSEDKVFPTDAVQDIVSSRVRSYETRDVIRGDQTTVRYNVLLDPGTSIEEITTRLIDSAEGRIRSVSWVRPKKSA